jgi:hypothetical protein
LRSAAARFCATVNALFTAALAPLGVGFPAPENVALAGAPNTPGCEEGAVRHESAVTHGGEPAAGVARHGEPGVQTLASYTSKDPSRSCGTSREDVKKNTLSPDSLASTNADSSREVPAEINPTQPPDTGLYLGDPPVHISLAGVPSPLGGSYSYTSPVPFASPGTNESALSKNNRPLSDRYRDR